MQEHVHATLSGFAKKHSEHFATWVQANADDVRRALDGKPPMVRIDRILWNNRDENDIDEIVLHDVTVHVEQMDNRCWWIGIYKSGNEATSPYWMGNFVADSRGRMRFSEQENAGIEWADDDAHKAAI